MKKIMAAFYLLAVVTALMLVDTRSIHAKETKLDLEERVRTLEIQAEISGQHIRRLESAVDDVKERPEPRSGESASDLKASVSALEAKVEENKRMQDVFISVFAVPEVSKLDKRVSNLEGAYFLDYVCAKPTAKQRADSGEAALLKTRAALCLQLTTKPR